MKSYLRSFQITLALCCLPGLVHAAGVVTEPTEASLRAALAGGGTVAFTCDGVIPLASTLVITNDTSFDAAGRSITLSGSNAVRVLQVNTGVSFALNSLTVANGRTNCGAGIFNDGGTVALTNCILADNQALGTNGLEVPDPSCWPSNVLTGSGGPAFGGAVWNGGVFMAHATTFLRNSAMGGNGRNWDTSVASCPYEGAGGSVSGGAICSTGDVSLVNCTFQSNRAQGGNGGNGYQGGRGGEARGGAILNAGGSVIGSNCLFQANNTVSGFDGVYGRAGYRGNAFGGGICSTGTLQLVSATFSANGAMGANAGGGGIFHAAGALTVDVSSFAGNTAQGDKLGRYYVTSGGFAHGGAVFNGGSAQITDTTISSNQAVGGRGNFSGYGPGGDGGVGRGGGACNSGALELLRCTLVGNLAQGGVGDGFSMGILSGATLGGKGLGGACASVSGKLSLANSTLSSNYAVGGQGGSTSDARIMSAGPGGDALGGSLYSTNTVLGITNVTIAANSVTGGPGGVWGVTNSGPAGQALTGGIRCDGGGAFNLYNSIVAQNTAGDIFGSFDGTPNLIGGDPRLSPLAANGGPTWTMALLPDSPAIDAAISLPDITTDQRGVARPYGAAPDLGAYEWGGSSFPSNFHLSSLAPTNGVWQLRVTGPTNRGFRLCISSNLTDWREIRSGATDERGMAECGEDSTTGWPACFYRVVSP